MHESLSPQMGGGGDAGPAGLQQRFWLKLDLQLLDFIGNIL